MKNKEYQKINLRDFRHGLTQLKDALASGQVYEVVEKGNSIAYFIPAQYDITIERKEGEKEREESIGDIAEKLFATVELKEEIPNDPYYKKLYMRELRKKYLKK